MVFALDKKEEEWIWQNVHRRTVEFSFLKMIWSKCCKLLTFINFSGSICKVYRISLYTFQLGNYSYVFSIKHLLI